MAESNSFIVEFDLESDNFSYQDLAQFSLNDDPNKIYWIHCDLDNESDFKFFAEKLNFDSESSHFLKSSERVSRTHERKDSLDLRIMNIFPDKNSGSDSMTISSLCFHLSEKYCFTSSKIQPPIIEEIKKNLSSSIQYAKTPCFILFLLLDKIMASYTSLTLDYEIKAENLDLHINTGMYNEVIKLKKRVMFIKRHVMIMLNMLMFITGHEINVISTACQASLKTLLNYSQTAITEIDSLRDQLNGTMDQINNAMMHHLNKAMGVLTAIAAIFMPGFLIAAIYGMNFQSLPFYSWKYGFVYALSLMLAAMFAMLYFFKRKKWF